MAMLYAGSKEFRERFSHGADVYDSEAGVLKRTVHYPAPLTIVPNDPPTQE